MAPAGCALDDGSLVAQLDRYRRLGTTAISITHRELQLVVRFDADADLELLRETIAIERQCCSFFMLDYDASDRRLSITVDNSDRLDALRALLSALRGSGIAPAARRSSLTPDHHDPTCPLRVPTRGPPSPLPPERKCGRCPIALEHRSRRLGPTSPFGAR